MGCGLLAGLTKGRNGLPGGTKGKRREANRPAGAYVVLDTNRLDGFAMEPVTCRWVQCDLTIGLDLYSRAITGLRLTPVSTKSVDVAAVLFETIHPRQADGGGPLPYVGVPSAV